MTRIVLIVCLAALVPYGSTAQLAKKRSDLYKFGDGVIYSYSRPLHWKGNDLAKFAGLVGVTAAASLLDRPVKRLFENRNDNILNAIERTGYHFGKPYSAFIFTGGFYLFGLVTDNRWSKDTGILLGVTLLTSGVLQTLAKDAFGRARPDTGFDPYYFKPFSQDAGFHSFPSGHFAVAFGIAHIVANRTDSVPLKIVAYTLAGTTFVSRLYHDAHWFSDMIFGRALAYFFGNTAIKRFAIWEGSREEKKVSWNLLPHPHGISITGRFK